MAALERHSASRQDGLERLLYRLLREEAGDVIGHIGMVYEDPKPRLVAGGLGD